MSADMASKEVEKKFRCFVHRFAAKIKLDDVKSIHQSLQYQTLCILYRNGSVESLKLDGKPSLQTLTNVKSLVLHNEDEPVSHTSCSELKLCIHKQEGDIALYTLSANSLKCVAKKKIADLVPEQRGVEAPMRVELVSYSGQYVVVCVNAQCLLCVEEKAGKLSTVATVSLPVQEGCRCYQVILDIVAVYDRATNKISFHSLKDGRLMSEVDMSFLGLETDSIQTWQLSTDLKIFLYVYKDNSIVHVDLERELRKHPDRATSNATSTVETSSAPATSNMKTTQFGDHQWREQLLCLHEHQVLSKSSPWYKQWQIRTTKPDKRPSFKFLSSITGFQSKKKGSIESMGKTSSHLKPPDVHADFAVEGVSIGPSVVTVSYKKDNVSILSMCMVATDTWATYRFQHGEYVLLANNPSLPHLVATETYLVCVFNNSEINQEQFVGELMVYGGAGIADTLCHLNKWGRCSVPVNTLEVGLKHRQLDTVSFFLKSKEKLFSSKIVPPVSPQSPLPSPSWATPSYSHHDDLIQLEPALCLLLQSARDGNSDRQAQQFSQQLLDITIDFLYGLLLDAMAVADTVGQPSEREDIQRAIQKLLMLVEDTRSCIRQTEDRLIRAGSVSASSVSAGSLTAQSLSNISVDTFDIPDGADLQWNSMDIEAVIEEGIMSNNIPELQQYLLERGEGSRGDYSSLKQTGILLALKYIRNNNMKRAKQLIAKLGLNVVEKLWDTALYTHDQQLRQAILEELQATSALTPEQVAMVKFLNQLTSLYPCRDFELVRDTHHHVKDSESPEAHRLHQLAVIEPRFDLSSDCKSLSRLDETDADSISDNRTSNESDLHEVQSDVGSPEESVGSEDEGYCEVLLDWIQWWDKDTKDRIRLERLLSKPGSNLDIFSKEIIWKYLLYHNMVDVIITWIKRSYSKKTKSAGSKAQWPVASLGILPPDFVNHLDPCPSYSKQCILKAFARYGIFDTDTLSDFPKLLQQLKLTGGVLQTPHPLLKCTAIHLEQFHLDLIQYCVSNGLPQFLWSYCLLHRIGPQFLHSISEGHGNDSWLPLFTNFFSLTQTGADNYECMYQASQSNALNVWGKDSATVGGMIQQGHTLAALATLMFSSSPLHQVTFVTQHMEAFDGLSSEVVEKAVKPYPKLHSSLFPAAIADSPYTDISVYDLLVENASFDPRRLFGWQSTNTVAGEDGLKELPFFSNASMVSRYGCTEQLHYYYYLKQGRPTFAFLTFLHEELKSGNPTIPHRRLAAAAGTSLLIGVKNFNNPSVSASCVAFQELLGHDSTMLRTHLQVGDEILKHKNNAVTGTMDKRREQLKQNEEEIVELLCGCVKARKSYRPIMLQALEAAILAGVARDKIAPSSFEAGSRWTVAVILCHLLRLPYTTVFLESCAQANKWLPFIWFAQTHQYPKEQLLNLLHLFRSVHLQEHLRYVLANAAIRSSQDQKQAIKQKKSDAAGKDVKSKLYTSLGVTKGKESDGSSTGEEEEPSALLRTQELDTDIDIHVTYEGSPSDVFGVVFAAQGSKSPWKSLLAYTITLRNPLFAELAACMKEAGVVPCLCSWLVSMMGLTEHAQFLEHHGKMAWKYSLQTLDTLIDIFIRNSWGSALVTGFDIFQPISPLLPFLQFYAEFTERRNYGTCRLLLDEFKEAVFHFHHDNPAVEDELGAGARGRDSVGDSQWLEQTTYRIIQHLLTSLPSVYELTQLLKLLDSESITLVFTKEDADFRTQCQMMQYIQAGEIRSVNFSALLSPASPQYNTECSQIIGQLLSRQQFDEARKFAQVAKVPTDHVTIAQADYQKKRIADTKIWSSSPARFNFYLDVANLLKKHTVSVAKVMEYFEREVDLTHCEKQKSYLYELCLDCIQTNSDNSETEGGIQLELYRKMWSCKIQQQVKDTQGSARKDPVTDDMFGELEVTSPKAIVQSRSELICDGTMPACGTEPESLSKEEVKALHVLIGEMLRRGEISESCRVATEFSLYSQDLAIILTFIHLSLGIASLETLKPDMLHLLRREPGESHRLSIAAPVALLRNSSAISLTSNIQPQLDFLSDENEEKIMVMEKLLKHCNQGQHTCRRIITIFKIAAVLDISYEDVVISDDFDILRPLLKTQYDQRFRLASDFLSTSALSSAEVAGFLSDAIIQSFEFSLGISKGNQDVFLDPRENFADFYQVVRLCQEPSLLGSRLLDAVASMAGELGQTCSKVLTIQTELLIMSHECFTAACNMEGISNILRAARVLTSYLETASEFSLMTRLLTGVSRYNEMIYIFDALQQNHQFELLLGKGIEKERKLKTAILDYLKRYHPADTDTYTMVALKFMMYREIAQLLQDNANKILSRLRGKTLENNSETLANLQKATQYLTEAAESYVKESCVRHAQSCLRQARLVALQIKYLPSNQQFINLTTKGANLVIGDHPNFSEAYIISEAYGRHENWVSALCNNVIVRGDMKYLQEFRAHLRLTPSLIKEAVDKYQQMTERPPQTVANVKKLLPFCKDIRLQYSIARDLGMRDVVGSLEKGDSKSYLLDVTSGI